MEGISELTMYRVTGLVRTTMDLHEKALVLEKELGTDILYTMLSIGTPLTSLSSSLGMTPYEMEYTLKRTPDHRKQYLNARSSRLADDSLLVLDTFKTATTLDKDANNAAKYHLAVVEKSSKVLNAATRDESGSGITVNNTVVIRSENEIPKLPIELQNAIEGEYVDIKP